MARLKNMTITIEEDVARWARVKAAEEDTSVARLVGGLLKAQMRAEGGYARAMRTHLSQEPVLLKKKGERYPSRDEIYER
jgi:hypothetical protein